MAKAVSPYRSVYKTLATLLTILLLVLALLAVEMLGAVRFLAVVTLGGYAGWAVRRARRLYPAPAVDILRGPWAAVLALQNLCEGSRLNPAKSSDFAAWSYASAMTYGLPESPPFRTLSDHQRAVRRIYGLRTLGAQVVAIQTGFPPPFVETVLSYFDEGLGEGSAGVGAPLRPRGPRPRAVAE